MTCSRPSRFQFVTRLLSVAALILFCSSCSGFWVSESSIETVVISPNTALLRKGDSVDLSATSTTYGGSTADVTSTATWSITPSTSTIVSVTSAGVLTASEKGTVVVNAASGGVTGTANVLVATSTLPSTINVGYTASSTTVAPSATFNVTATGLVDGVSTTLTTYVTWTSSDTGAATVDINGNVTVLSTATAGATFTITATAPTASSTIAGTSTTFTVS